MKREKRLIKNTIIISVGKVLTQLITFLLLPLYTSYLNTKEYGIADLLNTVISLMMPLITLEIEQSIFRELIDVRNNEHKKTEIITTSFFVLLFQLTIYLALFIIGSSFINNNYKVFLATNAVTYVILSVLLQIARGLGNNKKYAIASFISAISSVVLNIVFIVILKMGVYGVLLGIFLGQLIASIYLFISLKLFKYLSKKAYNKKLIKKMLNYSLPLVPNALSWWIFSASDRVIVSTFLGIDQNGILAASLKLSTILVSLYNMFNISWTESISMSAKDSDMSSYFNKMFKVMLNIYITIMIGLISITPLIFPILINEKFNSGYNLIPISIIASFFHILVGLVSVVYVAKKDTKSIAQTSIISAIINIIVHIILINYIGLFAAVVSSLIAYLILSLYRIYDINKKFFKIQFNNNITLYIILLLAILIIYYINNIYFSILGVVLSGLFFILLNYKSLKTIFNIILNKVRGNSNYAK